MRVLGGLRSQRFAFALLDGVLPLHRSSLERRYATRTRAPGAARSRSAPPQPRAARRWSRRRWWSLCRRLAATALR